jgi:hypothetical protein
MYTKDQARDLVQREIATHPPAFAGDDWIIIDDATQEFSRGWVFTWTSRLWAETNSFEYAIAGNAPLLVDRETGEVHVTGTAHPVQRYIDAYVTSGSTRV